MKKVFVSAMCALTLLTAACSSTTVIQSSDSEAKIYVDGQQMGRGTVTWTDTKIVGSTTQVMMKKDGCETQTFMFSRNEEFDAGACAGGVFLLVPFLWIQKYRPQHLFEFECEAKGKKQSSVEKLYTPMTSQIAKTK